jgi:predicted DNA-binding transcriptional regulator AlpA
MQEPPRRIPCGDAAELAAALDENEVARVIGVQVKTLRNWRVQGIGPRFVRTGRKLVRYRPCDVLAWQEANLRRSTSEGAR